MSQTVIAEIKCNFSTKLYLYEEILYKISFILLVNISIIRVRALDDLLLIVSAVDKLYHLWIQAVHQCLHHCPRRLVGAGVNKGKPIPL